MRLLRVRTHMDIACDVATDVMCDAAKFG